MLWLKYLHPLVPILLLSAYEYGDTQVKTLKKVPLDMSENATGIRINVALSQSQNLHVLEFLILQVSDVLPMLSDICYVYAYLLRFNWHSRLLYSTHIFLFSYSISLNLRIFIFLYSTSHSIHHIILQKWIIKNQFVWHTAANLRSLSFRQPTSNPLNPPQTPQPCI